MARTRHYAFLEAPSILGLRPTGVERLPATLLGHRLAERVQGRRAGRVEPDAAYNPERDPETLTLNAVGIADYSKKLADAVGPLVDDANVFPVVLGGDCSIVLGPTLALRRRGRYGLLFIDGHADFYQPEANPNGEAASMDLAFATGRGPALITNIEGRAPLVRDSDAVVFGFRDAEEQAHFGSQSLPAGLRAFDLPTVRRLGAEAAAREAVAHLSRPELSGFWIHVDADCLDDAVMPAVEYRIPDGLRLDELEVVLATALESGRAVGLEITVYNPALDTDGAAGKRLADLLAGVLSRAKL
jgi:arginase